ncbi:MAG: ferritin-like domain-containing protein [Planctomycetota bacterium]
MTLAHAENLKTETLPENVRLTLIDLLKTAYNMELETVINYTSNSIQLDGMLAMEVKESLRDDIEEELQHAQSIAKRIKVLGGDVPGSQSLKMEQSTLQPPTNTVDVEHVIRGVIDAETGAIAHYQKIIETAGDHDPVTEDLFIEIKGEEEEHRREFAGFLREYEALRTMFGKG